MSNTREFIIDGDKVLATSATNIDINKSIYAKRHGIDKDTLDGWNKWTEENARRRIEESLCYKCVHREACESWDDYCYDLKECEERTIAMTPEEFEKKMIEIKEEYEEHDEEECHILMDELMEDVLRSLGYAKGMNVFNDTRKWYA